MYLFFHKIVLFLMALLKIFYLEALDLKRLNKICNELNIFEFINKKNLSRFIDPIKTI